MSGILRYNFDHTNVGFAYNGSPDHFIHFKPCPQLNPQSLQVLVQDVSTGWKTLGPVRGSIQLPQVVFPPYAKLIVQGLTPQGKAISFTGHLRRGATYHLHTPQPGHHPLDATVTLGNGCSCCAYNSSQ